jgi:hypothetical protein
MITIIEQSKIETLPLSFNPKDEQDAKLILESFDFMPYLSITKFDEDVLVKTTTIDIRDIIYIKLFNNSFLPEIEIYCVDSKGILFNDIYPFDNDTIISIFIKADSEMLMPIRMDFRVTEYETDKSGINNNLTIKGILNIEDLHYSRYETLNGTSFDVVRKLSSDINLGFVSNISNTNDYMKWLTMSETYLQIINNITKNAFISEETFIWTFIDFHYRLNFIDIQTEINDFTLKQTWTSVKTLTQKEEESQVDLYLTNNEAFSFTNRFISKFNLINEATKINLKDYYKLTATWYDKNKNSVIKKEIKKLQNTTLDFQGPNGKLIGLTNIKSKLIYENFQDNYFQKIDIDNVHENYHLAESLNKYNLENLGKLKLVVVLKQANFSIQRFQNILVEIFNVQDVLSEDASVKDNGESKSPLENINKFLSGYWFVTGINYVFKKTSGVEQEIILMRRELSSNYGESKDEKHDLRSIGNTPDIESNQNEWKFDMPDPSVNDNIKFIN